MDDVVVVGAGPTGCAVAGEVARAGGSVTVLEKHAAPSPLSRAFGVHARTLELLDSRGLADELIATGTAVDRLQLVGDAGLDLSRLPSRFPFVLVTPQVHVDRLLERYALDAGARVERGVTVTGLAQDGDGVLVRAGEREWRARWVVGAD
ncbi:MAG: FAD-dependent oxidoreductase, partial [Klenkia sp.]|nr:FAD-dependent oxidoreductase [Klenkia sp.]